MVPSSEHVRDSCEKRDKMVTTCNRLASAVARWLQDFDATLTDSEHERACDAFAHLMTASRLLREEG